MPHILRLRTSNKTRTKAPYLQRRLLPAVGGYRRMFFMTCAVIVVPPMGLRSQGHEDHRQDREDEGLDKRNEQLKPIERYRQQPRRQEGHHEQHNLTGEDVTEEPEHKGDDAHELR